jgi:hypothetical protein
MPVRAERLVVDAAPCAGRISIDAEQAPLADILQELAAKMGFRLVVRAPVTERISHTLAGTPEDVLKRLMQGRNLVIDSNPAKHCGGRQVPTTVWILPAGESSDPRDAAASAPAAGTAAAPNLAETRPARPARPRGTRKRMSEEEWQQMKEDYKAGKIKADPETGMPVPVEQPAVAEPTP